MRPLAAILAAPRVPARCPPCGADLWAAVVREWSAQRRCFTALDVEREVGRRFQQQARRAEAPR